MCSPMMPGTGKAPPPTSTPPTQSCVPSKHGAQSVRCGNHGWSGWIDELGRVRQVATGKDGSIYFRGSSIFDVKYQQQYRGTLSFYVKYGDWFVATCGVLVLLGGVLGGDSKGPVKIAGDSFSSNRWTQIKEEGGAERSKAKGWGEALNPTKAGEQVFAMRNIFS